MRRPSLKGSLSLAIGLASGLLTTFVYVSRPKQRVPPMGNRVWGQRATQESRGQWDFRGRRVLRERLDLLDQLESLEARVVKVLLDHKAALERLDRQALQDRRVTRALLEQRATRETPEPQARKETVAQQARRETRETLDQLERLVPPEAPAKLDRRDRWGRPA
jgi:hypothetical protein